MKSPDLRISDSSLPKYKNPPVVETVLGIQFDPLPKLSNAHLGAFWASIRNGEWPAVSDAPTLEPQFERFKDSEKWARAGLRIKVSQDFASRIQIKSGDGSRMIQVQNGRLHFNWSGAGTDYPQYATVRDGFLRSFDQFAEFLKKEDLGEISPNQWEVTYVNHIPRNSVWRDPEDWSFFKPLNGAARIGQLDRLESFSGSWHFLLMENAGRLHVQWNHGAHGTEKDKAEIVQLMLTARGPFSSKSSSHAAVLDGLDLGHRSIVQAFRKLMSDPANQYWGLEDGNC